MEEALGFLLASEPFRKWSVEQGAEVPDVDAWKDRFLKIREKLQAGREPRE